MPVIPIKNTTLRLFPEKNLSGKICLSPFLSIEISIEGNVRLCGCAAWLPSTVGNLFENSLQEILSNSQSQAIRQSIIDGTYKYCDEKRCGIILYDKLNTIDNVPPAVMPLLFDSAKFIMPTEIIVAGDDTCNLSCPSCRTEVIKNSEFDIDRNRALGRRLMTNLFSTPTDKKIRMLVSTTGELFASPLLMEFVNSIDVDDYPNLELRIQTNGLLAEKNWHKLGRMQERVSMITVTVDAARAETYEQLRRGGKWSDIQQALKWISNKKLHNQMEFKTRMVVQDKNFSEMLEFYHQSMDLSVDTVEYGSIQPYPGMTRDQWILKNVCNPEHKLYAEAQTAFDQIRNLPKIFFYGGVL